MFVLGSSPKPSAPRMSLMQTLSYCRVCRANICCPFYGFRKNPNFTLCSVVSMSENDLLDAFNQRHKTVRQWILRQFLACTTKTRLTQPPQIEAGCTVSRFFWRDKQGVPFDGYQTISPSNGTRYTSGFYGFYGVLSSSHTKLTREIPLLYVTFFFSSSGGWGKIKL